MSKTLWFFFLLTMISMASLASKNSDAQDLCSEKYFTCEISGKPVAFCGADLGDVYNLMLVIGDTVVAEITHSDKVTVSEFNSGKVSLTSIYFKDGGKTYAITTCDGMECNPDKNTWISVLKGKNKIKEGGFCSPGSSTGFTKFPFKEDQKGRLILDKKNDLHSYFRINKNPKEAFLTENISWSD